MHLDLIDRTAANFTSMQTGFGLARGRSAASGSDVLLCQRLSVAVALATYHRPPVPAVNATGGHSTASRHSCPDIAFE